VAPNVLLTFWGPEACKIKALVGKRIRFGADLSSGISHDPELGCFVEKNRKVLGYWGFDLPVQDAELDRLLDAYRAKTDALRQAAATGGRAARLAFAEHLRANHETNRAFEVAEALLRQNPNDLDVLLLLALARTDAHIRYEPEETLAVVEQKAPKTVEWRGRIARVLFAATGQLTPGGQDWSDLKQAHKHCYSEPGNFDGAVFDRSDFAECAFRYSSFRGASFRGTDLTGSYFQDSDLTGAKYDCATKLPDDLDPVAVGMINVDGGCATP
jgi:hypothetical protein